MRVQALLNLSLALLTFIPEQHLFGYRNFALGLKHAYCLEMPSGCAYRDN